MKRLLPTIALVLSLLGGHALAETLTFTTYYYNDHLGNPVAATDERGDLLWRAHFTPYGERHENPANNAFGTVGYTGHAQDKASGLVYMGARYYDPVIGRFMAVDPVGFQDQNPQSFGRYLYANNNPLRFVDPDGRMSDEALLSGSWVPGFEGNLYNGPGGWGPIGGVRRGLTPQGELVNGQGIKEGAARSAIQTLEQRAVDLVKRNGEKNSVTIKHKDGQVRIDLAGKSHHSKELGDVPTPHVQSYKNNIIPEGPRKGQVGSITKDGDVVPANASILRMVDRYLKSQGQ